MSKEIDLAETIIALDMAMSVLLASINKADPAVGGRLLEAFQKLAEDIPPDMPGVANRVRGWTASLRGEGSSH
ncbi:MAG: hypothetical protein KZQ99_02385 [Candidatus Thiodiazotropha sp. (ex Dulcina madagascariensis)]|nr:hypothetical protein [Candidatus Thiodiazotropha sp. (ex Dulcina madagascariensis)]